MERVLRGRDRDIWSDIRIINKDGSGSGAQLNK